MILPKPDDARSIVDDSHPVLKGRIAGWAGEGGDFDEIEGICPVHGGLGKNVGQHILGLSKMCKACANKYKAENPQAISVDNNPLNL